jgi:hypothetical protein
MRIQLPTLGLVIVAIALWDGSVQAQNRGGGPGGGGRGFGMGFGMGGPGAGGVFGLAGNPAVQKEIGLEGEGVAKVQKVVDSFREEMTGEMEKAGLGFGGPGQFAELTPEERQAKMREMNEQRMALMKKLNEKFGPQLKETLSATQFERLQQIGWQAGGSQALVGPELVKALELSKEQQEKIAAINQEYAAKQREMGGFGRGGAGGGAGGAPPDFQAMRTKMQEMTRERDGKANDLLSKKQQEQYTKLKGKPFDLAQLMPMGPGGPGGGRGGPGGRPQGAAGRPEKKAE